MIRTVLGSTPDDKPPRQKPGNRHEVPMDTYLLARFFHILFAAVWLAQMLTAGHLARAFARGETGVVPVRSLKVTSATGAISGLATIGFGLWLVSLSGGWDGMPPAVGFGAALAVVLFIIGAWPVSRAWHELIRAGATAETSETLAQIARRVVLWSHISAGIWTATLATMVLRHL